MNCAIHQFIYILAKNTFLKDLLANVGFSTSGIIER